MALAERAELVAELTLQDKFSAVARKASGSLKGLETRVSKMGQGFKTIGQGMGTAIRNGTTLAIGGIAALTGLIALSVKEGQEVLKIDKLFRNAIASSGRVTSEQTAKLIEQQKALLELTGRDDELITQIQTRLVQMKATGQQTLALTPLIVAAATATGKSTETVTMAVGKALQGNAGALGRIGVVLPKVTAEQKKAITGNKNLTAAQKEAALAAIAYDNVLAELTKRFGKVNDALAGTLEIRLGVLRESMANIREEIGIKLLPALTRIVDVAGRSLVPAFGKFVDRILPGISKGIEDFASALEGGGAESAIAGIADALGSVLSVVRLLAAPAKAIVGAFMSLPKELQTIIIGGLAVNKLSGGLIGQGIGQILKGALGGVLARGQTPANPMFVADVTGGAGGLGGKVGKGLLATLTSLPVLIGAAVIAGVSTITWQNVVMPGLQEQAGANIGATETLLKTGSLADLERALRDLRGMPDRLDPLKRALYELNAAGVKTHTESLEKAIRDEIASRKAALTAEAALRQKNLSPIAGNLLPQVPGYAGIIARATAAGKTPTASAVSQTAERNQERAAKAAEQTARETAALKAAQGIASRAQAILQSIGNLRVAAVEQAARGTTAAVLAKNFSPTVNVSTGFNVNISVRAMQNAVVTSSSYNTGGRTRRGTPGRYID